MAKRVSTTVYAQMSSKEAFVAIKAAHARGDHEEAERIMARGPKRPYRGPNQEIFWLQLKSKTVCCWFLFDLLEAMGRLGGATMARHCVEIDRGRIPFGIGEDEAARAQEPLESIFTTDDPKVIDDALFLFSMRETETIIAQEVSAILDGMKDVCNKDIGLTIEQLVKSTAPYGMEVLEAAEAARDLDPKRKAVKSFAERYRMLWDTSELQA